MKNKIINNNLFPTRSLRTVVYNHSKPFSSPRHRTASPLNLVRGVKVKPTMPDYEGRYEGNGNGEDLDNYGSSPQPRGSSHGGPDDYSDSKSQVCSNLPFFFFFFLFRFYVYDLRKENT